jgi:hypothetical protein
LDSSDHAKLDSSDHASLDSSCMAASGAGKGPCINARGPPQPLHEVPPMPDTGRAWWAVDGAWSACGRVERAAVRQHCPPPHTGPWMNYFILFETKKARGAPK